MVLNTGIDNLFPKRPGQQEIIISNVIGRSRNGIVTLPGIAFQTRDTTSDITRDGFGKITVNSGSARFYCPIVLPESATIESVQVFGSVNTETFKLDRIKLSDSTSTLLGSAVIGSILTSISNPQIDNETYAYQIHTDNLDAGEYIQGLKIRYSEA